MASRQGWVPIVHSEANRVTIWGTSHTPLQHLLLPAFGSLLLAWAKGEWGQWLEGQWGLEARVLDLRSETQALVWFSHSLSLSITFKLT